MIPASARLHAAIVERRLTPSDDPELARHAADAIARHSRRGVADRQAEPSSEHRRDDRAPLAVERAEQKPEPVELVGWL
jgi:hypothetical protein